MTSVLNVDTIADKAGTGPVGLTKQDAATSIIHGAGTQQYESQCSSEITVVHSA